MSGTTVTLDAREFTDALNRYAKIRQLDNVTACNREAYQVALRAFWLTFKASAPEIQAKLGEDVAHRIVWTKSGKISKSQKSHKIGLVSMKSLAYNIMAARIYRSGKAMPKSVDIQAAASRMIHRRMAAVGYLSRGWLPAMKRLGNLVHDVLQSIPQGRPAPGHARPAIEEWGKSYAEIVNQAANIHSRTGPQTLSDVGGRALIRAINETTADMNRYVEKQLTEAKVKAGLN